jgi:hypothetical protein
MKAAIIRRRCRLDNTNVGKQLNLATSTCLRTLGANGSLFEIVRLDGTRASLLVLRVTRLGPSALFIKSQSHG